MDVLEAIEKRRSIRKFKSEKITEEQIGKLIEAARLAPSGCNVQPWRFIIVKDKKLKNKLCGASYNQKFIEDAPIVIVCCGDLLSWKRTKEKTEELLRTGEINLSDETQRALEERADIAISTEIRNRIPTTLMNVAIAIEHIILEAVELGLGSCWVRLFDDKTVKRLLKIPDHIHVVALLPIGVPDEDPSPRSRLSVSEITLHKSV